MPSLVWKSVCSCYFPWVREPRCHPNRTYLKRQIREDTQLKNRISTWHQPELVLWDNFILSSYLTTTKKYREQGFKIRLFDFCQQPSFVQSHGKRKCWAIATDSSSFHKRRSPIRINERSSFNISIVYDQRIRQTQISSLESSRICVYSE